MKILVTGSNGFIGKNLCATLNVKGYEVIPFDKDTTKSLEECVKESDFVIHLAGINRPLNVEEFYDGNTNLTYKLIEILKEDGRNIPLLLSSSIQAKRDNDYGKSKKQAEDLVFEYGKNADVFVYRLENAFGKWGRPNYNSVIATFCYNIANDLDIQINDPNVLIPFVYIDDIVNSFISCINTKGSNEYLYVTPSYKKTIGEVANLIYSFKESRKNLQVINMKDEFSKKLYSTYLSYLKKDDFSYELKMNVDNRGSFTEFLRSDDRGQVSINISKPGIVKGNHWHHTKNEKFLVVKGEGIIRFRQIYSDEIIEYKVSDKKLEVVDIPTGYTHNIENVGETDMVTVMWANEAFDPENPDTYYLEV
ncbi:MAG: SDR family oxidoreductase [Erysipelotrichaceae bacterium]|nr:SDR family oxidoreductase [Erysipelotrichaceae bacterium]